MIARFKSILRIKSSVTVAAVLVITIALAITAATATTVLAADAASFYKGKNLTLVVPYKPGGGYDTWGRLLAPYLAKYTGARVIVKNMPGAGGMLGIDPFDQPGVEAGKLAALALMGCAGHEDRAEAIRAVLAGGEALQLRC